MTAVRPWGAPAATATSWLQGAMLALLAAALLWTSFAGRAGMQVLSEATARQMVALHLHGVPGERQYIAAHGVPAPFVQSHCHAPLNSPDAQPGPYEVLAAASLGGSVLCAGSSNLVPLPAAVADVTATEEAAPEGRSLPPLIQPPR